MCPSQVQNDRVLVMMMIWMRDLYNFFCLFLSFLLFSFASPAFTLMRIMEAQTYHIAIIRSFL
jgi:hypothetical protein